MNRGNKAALFFLIIVATSCGRSPAGTPSEAIPVRTARVDLSIGTAGGEGPEIFGRVGGLLGLPDGRIAVADLQANEIRLFDSDGDHLFSFGREGEGPGDLAGPCCLALGPDGLLWVREAMNGRYSAFRLGPDDAEFVRTVRQQHGAMGLMASLTFDSDGRLVDVGERLSSAGDGSERVRYHLGTDGGIVATDVVVPASMGTLGSHRVQDENGGGVYYLWQPYGSHAVSAHGPEGRWARAVTDAYEIVSWDGEHFDTLRGPTDIGPLLTPAEKEAGEAALKRDADRVGLRVSALPYALPERRTPIQELYYDSGGRLWVQLSVSRGEPRKADVWNGVRLQERVTWPPNVQLGNVGWIGDGYALGVSRDDLGIERVVRLRFD